MSFARLFHCNKGIAATEFAVLLPVLLLLVLGGYQTMSAINAATHTTYLSTTLAELFSQSTVTLTQTDVVRIIESAPLINPDILTYAHQTGRSDIWNIAQVTVSSIQYSKTVPSCTAKCEYRGDVVFSYASDGSALPCGRVNNGKGSATVPASLAGPGSLVMVTVSVPWQSSVADYGLTFERTAYFTPRYVATVKYQTNCSGF